MGYQTWTQSGTTAVVRAVLPLRNGTTASTAATSAAKPDTRKEPSSRGGRSTKPQRYYGGGLQAVLPLWSDTTACNTWEVLPLWPAVLPLGPNDAQKKGNELSIEVESIRGCEKDVYMLIPP